VYCKQHDLFNCYLCNRSTLEYRELLGEYEDPRERELHELRHWKQEQIELESKWDPCTIADLLHMKIGSSFREGLEQAIRRLLQRCKQAEERAMQQQWRATKLSNLVDKIKLMVENE